MERFEEKNRKIREVLEFYRIYVTVQIPECNFRLYTWGLFLPHLLLAESTQNDLGYNFYWFVEVIIFWVYLIVLSLSFLFFHNLPVKEEK